MENKIVQLTAEQADFLFNDIGGVITELVEKIEVDKNLLEEMKSIQNNIPAQKESIEALGEIQDFLSKDIASFKNLIDTSREKLSASFQSAVEESTKDLVIMGTQANEEVTEQHKVFTKSTNTLLDKLTEDIKSKVEEMGNIKIEIDQNVLTTTIRNAMERMDFGELQKFITSVNEIKKAMNEANSSAITSFENQRIIQDENFESMKTTVEGVGSTIKILNETAQKTENLMIKQIVVLNKYTKKANLFNYMMVTIVTIVTYTGVMFYFIPETGKDLAKSILNGILQ